MFNRTKGTAIIALILLAVVLATINPYIANVKAQSQATVIVSDVTGGSVDPSPGTYNYNDGTGVALTATPDMANDFGFAYWVISTDTSNVTQTDNPYTLTVTGGVTYTVSALFYQPTVEPILPPNTVIPTASDAVVEVLHAVGGHTNPSEGTYYLTPHATMELTAIADSGWTFDHWVISGNPTTGHGGSPLNLMPTDNPYTVNHGFGYTYAYQPVFVIAGSPTGGTGGTGGTSGLSTEAIVIIAVLVVVLVIVAAFGVYAFSKRSKK